MSRREVEIEEEKMRRAQVEYQARRKEQMEAFLREKRTWSEARDAHRDAEAKRYAAFCERRNAFVATEEKPEFDEVYTSGPEFAQPKPAWEFNAWLASKGFE